MNSLEKRKYQSLIFQAFFARRHRVHFSPQSHATAFALHCTTFFLLGALAGKMVKQAISDCEWQKGMKNDKKWQKCHPLSSPIKNAVIFCGKCLVWCCTISHHNLLAPIVPALCATFFGHGLLARWHNGAKKERDERPALAIIYCTVF